MQARMTFNPIVGISIVTLSFLSLSVGQPFVAQTSKRAANSDPIPYGGGFCDRNKRIVIKPRFDRVGRFSEGLARVKLNGKWGFIDKTGREVIPQKYDDAWDFNEGMAAVNLNRKWGFVNASGQEVAALRYDVVHNFSEGLALVELNLKTGYIDKSGKEVIPLEYDSDRGLLLENGIPPVREGMALAIVKGKWGFLDKSGKQQSLSNTTAPSRFRKVSLWWAK